jgi:hypothetical protein
MLIAGLTTQGAISNVNSSYLGPFLTTQSTETEANVRQVVPVAGTLGNLAVNLGTAPGGASWTFTIRKTTGGTTTSTAITCKVEGGGANTTCSDAVHTAAFAAGDLIAIQATPASGPAAWGSLRWAVTLTQ